jgi:hypothetical protein
MCLACEQQEYFFRIWCAGFLARGEMPPGVTAEDLEALGLPPPKQVDSGTAPAPEAQERKQQPGVAPASNAFTCDSPDE